jgi:putative nucleotidyltransferase with HDIG domain
VLSIEAFARFDKLKPLYFSIDRVWKHSQALADLTRKICQVAGCDAEMTGHAYTAGLLHDIGKLALAQNFEEQYHRTVKRAEDSGVPVHTIEREVFGATHPETGAYLLAVWGLPLPIVRAVADHHLSAQNFTAPFSASTAVHLAEQLIAARNRPEDIVAAYPQEAGVLSHIVEICQLVGVTVDPNAPQREEAATAVETPTNTGSKREGKTTALRFQEIDPRIVLRRLALAALALVILLGVTAGVWLATRAKEGTKRVATAQPPAPPQVSIAKEEKPAPPVQQVKVGEIPSNKQPEFKLQAVLYNGEKSAAIINGVLLRIGDLVEGARVHSITPRQVTLLHRDGERTLRLE